jgi:FdhE protein
MRQGEVASQGKWTGATGGVSAPVPIIAPDPARRFAATASRLERLAFGHPMEDWLRFMAQLARAQHQAVTTLPPPPPLDSAELTQAVEARAAPLAADRYRPGRPWQRGLSQILQHFAGSLLPDQAKAVIADLETWNAETIDALADSFLQGEFAADRIGHALYIAAALQVHFTAVAGVLAAETLRLLPDRGLCPCCGSTPVAGIVTASGPTPGSRYLHCSLCSTAWNHTRAVCITCGRSGHLALKSIEGDGGVIKAETCDDCHTYAKLLYAAKDTQVDAFADDLASLPLEVLVAEAGWSRHAPNPWLLAG